MTLPCLLPDVLPAQNALNAYNILKNGNFVDTSIWSAIASTFSVDSNICTITGDGSNAAFQITQTTAKKRNGQKMYLRFKVMVTDAVATSINIVIGGNDLVAILAPAIDTWYTYDLVYTDIVNNGTSLLMNIKVIYADASTANLKVMNVQECMIVEMDKTDSNPFFKKIAADMQKLFPIWKNSQ